MGAASSLLAKLPDAGLFLVTTVLAVYFTSLNYPAILAFLKRQQEQHHREEDHAAHAQEAEAQVHGQQGGDGGQVRLPRQKAGLQQGVDDQSDGVEGQQGQALLHVSHEEAPQSPGEQPVPGRGGDPPVEVAG